MYKILAHDIGAWKTDDMVVVAKVIPCSIDSCKRRKKPSMCDGSIYSVTKPTLTKNLMVCGSSLLSCNIFKTWGDNYVDIR